MLKSNNSHRIQVTFDVASDNETKLDRFLTRADWNQALMPLLVEDRYVSFESIATTVTTQEIDPREG